jgi:hypothetical protein
MTLLGSSMCSCLRLNDDQAQISALPASMSSYHDKIKQVLRDDGVFSYP